MKCKIYPAWNFLTEHLHNPFLGNLIALLIVFLISSEVFNEVFYSVRKESRIFGFRENLLTNFLIIFIMHLCHHEANFISNIFFTAFIKLLLINTTEYFYRLINHFIIDKNNQFHQVNALHLFLHNSYNFRNP